MAAKAGVGGVVATAAAALGYGLLAQAATRAAISGPTAAGDVAGAKTRALWARTAEAGVGLLVGGWMMATGRAPYFGAGLVAVGAIGAGQAVEAALTPVPAQPAAGVFLPAPNGSYAQRAPFGAYVR